MELPDFTQPLWFLVATLIVFVVVIGRYLLIAGLFYGAFYLWFPHKWQQRKINEKAYKPGQLKKEIQRSTFTALLFAVSGSILLVLWQKGFTKYISMLRNIGYGGCQLALLLHCYYTKPIITGCIDGCISQKFSG